MLGCSGGDKDVWGLVPRSKAHVCGVVLGHAVHMGPRTLPVAVLVQFQVSWVSLGFQIPIGQTPLLFARFYASLKNKASDGKR